MWDWSGSKVPPPKRAREEAAVEAQSQGVTPVRRDVRVVPIYRDPRSFRTLPPTAPASAYPDPLDISQPAYPNVPMPPPRSPYPAQPPMQQQPQPYPYPQAQPQPYPQPNTMTSWGNIPPPQPAYMPQQYQPYPAPMPPQPMPYAPAPQMSQQPQSMPTMAAYQQNGAAMPADGNGDRPMWEGQASQMELPNMDVIEANYIMLDPRWRLELRKAFKRARRDFLKYVGYHHVNELMAAGLLEEDIAKIKKGKAPENFNVHVRIPFDYGGTNDFSNLVLIQTHPFHVNIHKFLDMQILSQPQGMKPRRLFIPAPKGKVYFPGVIEVSSGGKDKHDRSVYAGFLESTFEIIAQKTSLGR